MKAVASLLAALSLAAASAAAENLVVPEDVYELLKSRNCEQVSDFFAGRPSVEEPPYAMHTALWGKRQIAVWCTNDGAKEPYERSYTLLLWFDDKNHPLSNCPDKIEGNDFIGGLSFIEINEPAEWYYFVGTHKKIPLTGKIKSKAISSIYDGTGNYFICVAGKWATRGLH